MRRYRWSTVIPLVAFIVCLHCARSNHPPLIITSKNPSPLESLAAKEIRRYVVLRTGRLLSIVSTDTVPSDRDAIVLSRPSSPLRRNVHSNPPDSAAGLGKEGFRLQTVHGNGRNRLHISGQSEQAVLYGAYRFAECLGIRFYLHGDVIPDHRIEFRLPELDEIHQPLFRLRGIQPFHDFPEGPDWWNAADYKAVFAQLVKLRMNFFGLHTYPEAGPNAEPTVWIGPKEDIQPQGKVMHSYPSSYQNTLRGNWGYQRSHTSDYHFGASMLFEEDGYGPDAMLGNFPEPHYEADCNAVFNATGVLLNDAFAYARDLGIRTCVGTETPLTIPNRVQERLRGAGKNPKDRETVKALYQGIFDRIRKTYPIDYYWFWTPESWTWDDASPSQIRATMDDLSSAIQAAKEEQAPFGLATCGWVLGPPSDRGLFARGLPRAVAVSCINRDVGKAPVDRHFAAITGRSKWAIPWLEDDPSLTSAQLWAGRMRKDAADALTYGCDGFIGIHWRTNVLSPNVSAMASAAWDPAIAELARQNAEEIEGPVGGVHASLPDSVTLAGPDADVYKSVRDRISGYRLRMPNGQATVTLQFIEPSVTTKNRRVFDVSINGRRVMAALDIFSRVGVHRPMEAVFAGVPIEDGWLRIDFTDRIHYPCLAGLVVRGASAVRKINCGGPAMGDYAPDWPETPRFLPVNDFYRDWVAHQFGQDAPEALASLFSRLDGRHPIPSEWVHGPGGLRPDPRPWETVRKDFAFVDTLALFRRKIRGSGNRERFDYWLHQFESMRETAHLRCLWHQFERCISNLQDDAQYTPIEGQAIYLRREMVKRSREIFRHLLATVSTPGEMGTIANWEQHIFPDVFAKNERPLIEFLGKPLPENAVLPKGYDGPLRIVVPTLRSTLRSDESLQSTVRILSMENPVSIVLHYREMGTEEFRSVPFRHVSRGVYTVSCPIQGMDMEYYIEAETKNERSVFPVTAPTVCQTVVAWP